MCPNRSGIGSFDYPDRFEQVFDQYDILEVAEKIFTFDFSKDCRQKMFIFGALTAFISNYTYYILSYRKLNVITLRKCDFRFLIRPLDFSVETLEHAIHIHEYLEKKLEVV